MAGGQATSTIKRRRIGSLLRRFREQHDPVILSKDAAAHIDIDATRLGRIERGQYRITPEQITGLLDFYGITDDTTHRALREAALEDPTEHWWYAYRRDLPQAFIDYVALEDSAIRIKTTSASGVPGLLQVASYAREMQETSPIQTARERSRSLFSVRMARQQVINRPVNPVMLEVLLPEITLNSKADSMSDQVRHLIFLNEQPNVAIKVLTSSTPIGCLPSSTFTLMNFAAPWPATVHLDSHYGGALEDDPRVVEGVMEIFSGMEEHALPEEENRGFLEDRLKRIKV